MILTVNVHASITFRLKMPQALNLITMTHVSSEYDEVTENKFTLEVDVVVSKLATPLIIYAKAVCD